MGKGTMESRAFHVKHSCGQAVKGDEVIENMTADNQGTCEKL